MIREWIPAETRKVVVVQPNVQSVCANVDVADWSSISAVQQGDPNVAGPTLGYLRFTFHDTRQTLRVSYINLTQTAAPFKVPVFGPLVDVDFVPPTVKVLSTFLFGAALSDASVANPQPRPGAGQQFSGTVPPSGATHQDFDPGLWGPVLVTVQAEAPLRVSHSTLDSITGIALFGLAQGVVMETGTTGFPHAAQPTIYVPQSTYLQLRFDNVDTSFTRGWVLDAENLATG